MKTKKLDDIYKEWRGNESCYDNGRPVFEADELLDFAKYVIREFHSSLPSDEEIEAEGHKYRADLIEQDGNKSDDRYWKTDFIAGAGWMKEKIKLCQSTL